MAENDGKMKGWLYIIRFNRFGLQYSRKRYFILDENCLKSFKLVPKSEKEVCFITLCLLFFLVCTIAFLLCLICYISINARSLYVYRYVFCNMVCFFYELLMLDLLLKSIGLYLSKGRD